MIRDEYCLVLRVQALNPLRIKCGDDGLKDTPVPMPNTEVKLQRAESSWGIAPCEDRALPCTSKRTLAPGIVCQGSDIGELSERPKEQHWKCCIRVKACIKGSNPLLSVSYDPLVKRLRHQPFTLVSWVRIPHGSLMED